MKKVVQVQKLVHQHSFSLTVKMGSRDASFQSLIFGKKKDQIKIAEL